MNTKCLKCGEEKVHKETCPLFPGMKIGYEDEYQSINRHERAKMTPKEHNQFPRGRW